MSADRHFGLSLYEPPPVKHSKARNWKPWVYDGLCGVLFIVCTVMGFLALDQLAAILQWIGWAG